jgi:hypothetical protein
VVRRTAPPRRTTTSTTELACLIWYPSDPATPVLIAEAVDPVTARTARPSTTARPERRFVVVFERFFITDRISDALPYFSLKLNTALIGQHSFLSCYRVAQVFSVTEVAAHVMYDLCQS